MKKLLGNIFILAIVSSCSSTGGNRNIASRWGMNATEGAETGVYVSKDIRDRSGSVGVLRELDLTRDYSGDNLKGLWIEVFANGGVEKRTQIDIVLNNQTIESHAIMLRRGRQHLWTDINREVRDDIRQLQVRYNPMDVSVQSMTVLVSEIDRGGNDSGDATYSQIFERVDRRSGGREYTLIVPRHVEAQYLNLEAKNYPVKIHEIIVDGLSIEAPLRPLSPNNPVEIRLPKNNDRILDIRFRAEGYSGDNATLKVSVSKRPLLNPVPDPRPFPIPGPRPPHRRPLNEVKVFTDDRCSNFITDIDRNESCERLNNFYGSKNVWSVKVNDRCINTSDTTFSKSCEAVKPLTEEPIPSSNPLVRLYSDDRCQVSVLDLDESINCDVWKGVLGSANIWSVSVSGRCLNIPDVTFSANTCSRFSRGALSIQRPVAQDAVELYTDDRCQNKIIDVQRGDRCDEMSELFGSLNVWSIKFRGRCENIPDLNFKDGCNKYSL